MPGGVNSPVRAFNPYPFFTLNAEGSKLYDVNNYKSAQLCDKDKFGTYQIDLLNNNVFIPPSQFETCFLSTSHSDEDIQSTIEAMDLALNEIS